MYIRKVQLPILVVISFKKGNCIDLLLILDKRRTENENNNPRDKKLRFGGHLLKFVV